MRSHAKASTAGSTQRQAGRLGRFVRGAFAGRGVSSDGRGSGAPSARRLALPASVFSAAVVVMALIATPASALKTHLFKETFGSAAQPSFTNARGIAIDQSSGNVLVLNAFPNTISRYNADGTPDSFSAVGTNVIDGQGTGDGTPQNELGGFNTAESQIAIDNSGTATDGNIYVTQGFPNLINIFSEDGEYLGQLTAAGATPFSEACGVAVDSGGAVYVGDYSGGIRKFVPAANPPVNADNTATFTTVNNPCTLATGVGPSAGSIFAVQPFGPISKLDSSSGELKYIVSPDINATLTVDPGSGNVFAAATSEAIKEFDASGAGSATSVSTISLPNNGQGMAIDSSGDILVSIFTGPKVSVFDSPVVALPDVVTGSASNIDQTTATLNGTVSPDGDTLEECKFEYGISTSYGQSVPCAESTGAIGTGTSPVPVHADISGLTIGTVYHFRLVAKNANGTVEGSDSSVETFSKPVIKEQWAHEVIYTEAALKAKLNPKGFATTYHIEYGTTVAYGQSTPDVGIGSDEADHVITRGLEGLTPDTTYHYRFVATNAIGTSDGPDHIFTTYPPFSPDTNCANQTFRTGPALNLADCRAYEMVSPIDKKGGEIRTGPTNDSRESGINQASLDGEKITYSSFTSFADQPSGHYANQYLSTRGPNGWSTEGINAPQDTTIFDPLFEPFIELQTFYTIFTEDLSYAWVKDFNEVPLTPEGQPSYMNLYRRDNSDGSFQALTVNAPLAPTNKVFGEHPFTLAENQGISADGSHSFFAAQAKFTPDASDAENRQLYEFFDGEIRLVSVLPNGEASTATHNTVGKENSIEITWRNASRRGAVSDDGSRVFWTASNSFRDGPLYVRIDGERTVPVSDGDAQFWTATSDGKQALFSEGELSGEAGGEADLYAFDVDSETKTMVASGVYGVAGTSKDLSYVYFLSNEALDSGATAGSRNLYVSHGGETSFIATILPSDFGTAGFLPEFHAARVTPDGEHLAFQSLVELTGYDNTDLVSGEPDTEIYVYDIDTETLTCASCNPSGVRSRGRKLHYPFAQHPDKLFLNAGTWAAAWLPTEGTNQHSSHTFSDDGNHLFFNAHGALVPQDTNGVQDVYEWRREGIGGCEKPDGCISLISTGESPVRSTFIEAGADGRDVFFTTRSSIHPEDPGLIDVYDARSGGGYPYVPRSIPCVGDACQSVPPAPNDATPASAGFKGAGDPKPRKRRARCRARSRKAAKGGKAAKRKTAKRCSHAKRGAGR